ncbi:NACHT domain-containing protein [Streptomyces sp. NBC_00201]|uniref:NACHT domain-containing protein n=1 Tax=Streptomyces sp. NBC_00201 TaxID=2975679 RepID=UPI00225A6396|nr:NACHT domain-containing protein [Streptomyces sp. NBC_00201]MCX5247788.1 NACHT domain-containing protein [Streptomyces sp. NBC_00201]
MAAKRSVAEHGEAEERPGTHNEVSGGTHRNVIQARDIYGGVRIVAMGLRGLVAVLGLVLLAAHPELPLPRRYDVGPVWAGWALLGMALGSELCVRLLAWVERRRRRAWQAERNVRRVADTLAEALYQRYARDERLAKIEPHPIEVTWLPLGEDAREGRLPSISEYFERTEGQRLVVLGGAGAGKTVLALRLAHELLQRRVRGSNEPLPLVVSLASWDPDQGLYQWLARQLAAEYREQCTPAAGVFAYDVALHLLWYTGWVLPVLDGFDELAPNVRKKAFEELAKSTRARDRKFVFTSRKDEYDEHVPDPSVFQRTEIVLQDLTDSAVEAYLSPEGAPSPRWGPVLAALRKRRKPSAEVAQLRRVLRVPLMVGLARVAYGWGDKDPRELLSPGAFRDDHALERHLYDAFLDVAYGDSPDVRAEHGGWDPGEARDWAGYLAGRMRDADQQDFAWWRLEQEVPWPVRVAGLLPAYGVAGLLVVRVGFGEMWWGGWLPLWGAFVALGLLMLLAFPIWRDDETWSVPWRLTPPSRRQLGRVLRRWKVLLSVGVSVLGLGAALVAGLGHWSGHWRWYLVVGGAATLLTWVPDTVRAVWRPADPAFARTPAALLAADRRAALVVGWVVPLRQREEWPLFPLLMPPALLGAWQLWGGGRYVVGVGDWLITGVGTLLVCALYSVGFSAWGRYTVARVWLAAAGRLPWRLTAFLEDAHARGVLRQSGGEYRFRHIELRNRLADAAVTDDGARTRKGGARAGGLADGWALLAGAAALVLMVMMGLGSLGARPPADPVRSLPPACSLLDARDISQLMSDGAKLHDDFAPGVLLLGTKADECTVSEQSPFAREARIGIGAFVQQADDRSSGTRNAAQKFRTDRSSTFARGHVMVDALGDEAYVNVGRYLWASDSSEPGSYPWGARVQVRAGNVLLNVTYAEEFAGRERTVEVAEILTRHVLRSVGLGSSGGRELADVPRPRVPVKDNRLADYSRGRAQSVHGATWRGDEPSHLWKSARLPFAFRAPNHLSCETGDERDLLDFSCEDEGVAQLEGLVPDMKVRIAFHLGCGTSCHEGELSAYERGLLKYGKPRWKKADTDPRDQGLTYYAEQPGKGKRYEMFLRRQLGWNDKGKPLTWRIWVQVDVPESDRALAQKIVNDIFTQTAGLGRVKR